DQARDCLRASIRYRSNQHWLHKSLASAPCVASYKIIDGAKQGVYRHSYSHFGGACYAQRKTTISISESAASLNGTLGCVPGGDSRGDSPCKAGRVRCNS